MQDTSKWAKFNPIFCNIQIIIYITFTLVIQRHFLILSYLDVQFDRMYDYGDIWRYIDHIFREPHQCSVRMTEKEV